MLYLYGEKKQDMFKKILIPVSSEFYSKKVIQRGLFFAEKFNSVIDIIYIIEEKTLNQTDKQSDAFRTHYEIEDTKKEIIGKQKQKADNIIFEDARSIFKEKGLSFTDKKAEGQFSSVIKNEIEKNKYNLIIMGYERGCNLNYRIFDDINIPIWVESETEGNSILAVCSNLAPNQKVPEISIKLADSFNWPLHMLYVVDMQDNVQVDKTGRRSNRRTENDLIGIGETFVEQMRGKDINVQLVKGNIEKETFKAAKKIGVNLIILGREKKKKGILGLPVKNVKRKMAGKCKYSILFVN